MIDLHTHTKFSDGSDDVLTLLQKAETLNLEVLSITDHSTCKAYEEISKIDIKKYYTGKLIKGCELYTTVNGQVIELLGYNIDTEKLNQVLPKIYHSQIEDDDWMKEAIFKKCNELDIHIDYKAINYKSGESFASNAILKEINKYPENKEIFDNERAWNNPTTFYRECVTNSKSKFFINKEDYYPSILDVIKLIKETGRLSIYPSHIYIWR